MELKEMYDDLKKDNEKLMDKLKWIKIENDIQTVAVILVFLFGIETLRDISKRVK